jgi:hypothetical protein
MLVSSLIDSSTVSWKAEVVEELFLPMDAEVIRSIPLSTHRLDDFWAWHYEKNGLLSVRLAYRMLVLTKKRREDWLQGIGREGPRQHRKGGAGSACGEPKFRRNSGSSYGVLHNSRY